MSNLEKKPSEVPVGGDHETGPLFEILSSRLVPLGGVRALEVRRTLPQRARSTIGAWCFADHYGPVDVTGDLTMDVRPHPHTGLQTVSWLFEGEIEHRDSVGSVEVVRPGQLNLMTAGRGISHSEVSTPATTVLHGVQLWVVLPDEDRDVAPFFEHHDGVLVDRPGARIRVFVGELLGAAVAATTFSPLVAAQIDLAPDARLTIPVRAAFEYGVLVDRGPVHVGDDEDAARLESGTAEATDLAYLGTGRDDLVLRAGPAGARVILLGGTPLHERFVMWWNFIGRSHDEVAEARIDWQTGAIGTGAARDTDPDARFGLVEGYPGAPLPAPELPTVRLKPRG